MSPTVSSSALMVTFSPSLRHRAYWGTKLAKLSMILLDFDSCQLKVKTCPNSVYPDSDLVVGEDPGDDDDSSEDHSEVKIVIWRFLQSAGLDTIGEIAEQSPEPEQTGEASEESFAELDPLRCCWRWSQGVRAVSLKVGLSLG